MNIVGSPPTGLPLSAGQYGRVSVQIKETSPGKHSGHIVLPWSRNESGWGTLRIPFGMVVNGNGPTALLTGANHGDELEGAVALLDFYQSVDVNDIAGAVLLVPMLNYPAFLAGRRLSPIDGGNMNRSFLGRSDGTLTEQIAHFVESELIERAQAVLDIHSGGRTMMFHPFAVSHKLPCELASERARQALLAFGAPIGLVLEELDSRGMLDDAVESRGKLFLSTELGGGGSTTPDSLRIARRGVHNFLAHLGILQADPVPAPQPTRLMTNDASGYLLSQEEGLIEYVADLGDIVNEGQTLARLYDTRSLGGKPKALRAPASGMLIGRLHGGLVRSGDFLALIAIDL